MSMAEQVIKPLRAGNRMNSTIHPGLNELMPPRRDRFDKPKPQDYTLVVLGREGT